MKSFKNILFTCIIILSFVLSLASQEPVHWDIVQKIREEALENSRIMETASYLIDVYGPRVAGSPSYMQAAEWAKNRLTEYGLVNAQLEEWGELGLGWRNDYTSVHMMTPQYMPVIAYPLSWTSGTNGKVTGKVIFIDFENIKSESDLLQYKGNVKDAIIFTQPVRELTPRTSPDVVRRTQEYLDERSEIPMVPREQRDQRRRRRQESDSMPRNEIMSFLYSEGAAVFVDPGRTGWGTVHVFGRLLRTKDAPKPPPTLAMAAEHYNRIIRILEKDIPVTMEVEIKTSFFDDDLNDYNVIAEIPGSDLAKEVVMLGGHLDGLSASGGATDDIAGCAVAMEAVRIGSTGYVKKHFKPGTPEYDNFSVYFNMDNGAGKFRGIYLQENEATRPIFTEWIKPFKDMRMTHLSYRNTGSTDHVPFDRAGLPGFQFIQDGIGGGHTNMDFYDRLVPEDLKQAAIIMASFVYHAAMRDGKFPRKTMK